MNPLDRRTVLKLAGAGAALVAGAASGACGGSGGAKPPVETAITRGDKLEGDLSLAALLASLENLLVFAYQDGLTRKDRFGPYPPAVQAVIEETLRQHKEHAVAWNSILSGAGKPGITGNNLTVKGAILDPQLARGRDTTSFLGACLDLETTTAVTYLATMGTFENVAALKVAASIHPVENQHIAALSFLLGRPLSSDAFAHPDGARTPTDAIG